MKTESLRCLLKLIQTYFYCIVLRSWAIFFIKVKTEINRKSIIGFLCQPKESPAALHGAFIGCSLLQKTRMFHIWKRSFVIYSIRKTLKKEFLVVILRPKYETNLTVSIVHRIYVPLGEMVGSLFVVLGSDVQLCYNHCPWIGEL